MTRTKVAIAAALVTAAGLSASAQGAGPRHLSDQDAVRRSFSELQARADVYGIRSATDELKVRQVRRDPLRFTHVRMDQFFRGIPVFGDQLVTHFDANGRLYFISGTFTPMTDLSTRPTFSPLKALDEAMGDFDHEVSVAPHVKLVVLSFEVDEPLLAYHIELKDIESDTPKSWSYFINAHTGRIELDWNNLHTAPAVGTGHSYYSGDVELSTSTGIAGFQMIDAERGNQQTNDMNNGTGGNGTVYADADNEWGNGTQLDRATIGVDAHFGAQATYDYYNGLYGRNGIADDGRGALSRTHYGNNYVNAFWDDGCFCMTYGDGDGNTSDPLVTLDIAAHEMTHGVTSSTAGLIYASQPGGLNESMSDVFGTAVEFHAAEGGTATTPEYWMGEDCWTPRSPNDALRYLDHPTDDGISIDNASKYRRFMDVHYSSGVSNNVYYLASEGGTNDTSGMAVPAIGRDKTEAIFYRSLVDYMTPRTNWSQARGYMVQAARDLYSQTEADGIGRAWTACGVN